MGVVDEPICFSRDDFRSLTAGVAPIQFDPANVAQRADQSRQTADTKADGLNDILERLNKLAAKPVESDDSEAGFKFSSSSRVIKATDLDEWSEENLGQLIKILEKIKISDLVANKDSMSVEEKASNERTINLLFTLGVNFDHASTVNLVLLDQDSARDIKKIQDLSKTLFDNLVKERSRIKENNLNPDQQALRDDVVTFLSLDNDPENEKSVKEKLETLKGIIDKVSNTRDLLSYGRMTTQKPGQIKFEAKLYDEISGIFGADEIATKLTKTFIEQFHSSLAYSEPELYSYKADTNRGSINKTILGIREGIFDKLLIENSLRAIPPDRLLDDELGRIYNAPAGTARQNLISNYKLSLIKKILFPDISKQDSIKNQEAAIKNLIKFEHKYQNYIGDKGKTSRDGYGLEKSIKDMNDLVQALDTFKRFPDQKNDTHLIALGSLISEDGQNIFVNDSAKNALFTSLKITGLDQITDQHKNIVLDLNLGDLTNLDDIKENLNASIIENGDKTNLLKADFEAANREIFSALGDHEFRFMSTLTNLVDRFLYEYRGEDVEIKQKNANFFAEAALEEHLKTTGKNLTERKDFLTEKLSEDMKSSRAVFFPDPDDETKRLDFVNTITESFDDFVQAIKANGKVEVFFDPDTSIDEHFTNFKDAEGTYYKDLKEDILRYGGLTDKNSKDAYLLETKIIENWLKSFKEFVVGFDYDNSGLGFGALVPDSVKELLGRYSSGSNMDNYADFTESIEKTLNDKSLFDNSVLERDVKKQKELERLENSLNNINNGRSGDVLKRYLVEELKPKATSDDDFRIQALLKETLIHVLKGINQESFNPQHSTNPATPDAWSTSRDKGAEYLAKIFPLALKQTHIS
ncbi:MAG: hypothetical protein ACOYK1_02630 [Vampirovibrionia bacterium]